MGSINLLTLFVTLALSSKAFDKGVESAKKKSDGFADKLKDGFGKAIKAVGKAVVAATTAVAAGIAKITQASVASYGEYEQLVGGVKTLFGTEAGSLKEYAASIGQTVDEAKDKYNSLINAQSEIFSKAQDAYKNVQMSANDYMNTVTSFAASLIQGLGGDTEKAAEKADLAITDMADNANKMGTAMESIQNAYQGFAKQNYTMLDNLKLGYGGTKTEMERLLKDAEALQKQNGITAEYSIQNFADIVEAIHVVQTEMGITGTSAKEAGSTIQGSLAMVKAQWQNLLTAFADEDANLSDQINRFTDAITTAAGNIVPRIQQILPSIVNGLDKLISALIPMIPELIGTLVPAFTNAIMGVMNSLTSELSNGADMVMNAIISIIGTLSDTLPELITTLLEEIDTILLTTIRNAENDLIPTVLQLVADLIDSLASTIPDVISSLLEETVSIVEEFLKTDGLNNVLQAVISLEQGAAEAVLQAIPFIISRMPKIITSVVDFLLGAIPQIAQTGIQLLSALVEAMPEIISAIVEALPELITGIVDAIIEFVPEIVVAGVQLLSALMQNLDEIIAQIVVAIPDIIDGIIGALTDSTPRLIEAGFELFMALVTNLPEIIMGILTALSKLIAAIIQAIPTYFIKIAQQGVKLFESLVTNLPQAIQTIKRRIPEVISGIVSKFREGWNNMKQVGKNLIEGVGEGIMSAANALYERVKSVVSKIKGFFTGKSGFDTHSPSKWSQKVFENVMAGSILGTERGAAGLEMAMQDAVERAKNSFDMGAITYAPAVQSGRVGDINVSVEVTTAGINSEMDAENVGRIIGEKAARQIRYRGGVSFA
nr:MAG TPA: tail tape measure protein [Caudoviricetes sp.]